VAIPSRQKKTFERYLHRWQARLGLQGWKIELHLYEGEILPPSASDSERAAGQFYAWTQERRAEVHIAVGQPTANPEEIMLHELLHILLSDIRDGLDRLKGIVSADVHGMARGEHLDAEEVAVHRLTRAFMEDAN